MKNKTIIFSCLYFVLLFTLLVSIFVFTAQQASAGGTTIATGITSQIDVHGQCRRVTNNHATLSIFVPHLSSAEWESFILHHPGHVALAACPWSSCVPRVGYNNAQCQSGEIRVDLIYDGTGCGGAHTPYWIDETHYVECNVIHFYPPFAPFKGIREECVVNLKRAAVVCRCIDRCVPVGDLPSSIAICCS